MLLAQRPPGSFSSSLAGDPNLSLCKVKVQAERRSETRNSSVIFVLTRKKRLFGQILRFSICWDEVCSYFRTGIRFGSRTGAVSNQRVQTRTGKIRQARSSFNMCLTSKVLSGSWPPSQPAVCVSVGVCKRETVLVSRTAPVFGAPTPVVWRSL